MQVTAQLNNLRIAPRKVRLVTKAITGLDVNVAQGRLAYLAKRSARPLVKLLQSAVANGRNNFGLVERNLFIKAIIVNEGPKLKRFMPKGFGRVSPLEKKTSHIKVILDEKVPGLKAEAGKPAQSEKAVAVEQAENQATSVHTEKKPTFARPAGPGSAKPGVIGGVKNIGRKIFRRKVI